eukprot:m.444883 g.444883  ORF g.444883 m.444883 type:complete len:427 (-) comp20300_c6_seq2:1677-2957(-)
MVCWSMDKVYWSVDGFLLAASVVSDEPDKKRCSQTLLAPVLRPRVQLFDKLGEHGVDAFVHGFLKVLDGSLLAQVEAKLVLHLHDCLVRVERNVVHVRVDHHRKQVEDQVGIFAQDQKRIVTVRPKLPHLVARHPTHALDHFLAEFKRRRVWLWVSAENVPKVDVEQMAVLAQQQVVQVSVANPEQKSHHTVPSTALDIVVHHVLIDAIRCLFVRIELAKVVLNGSVVRQDASNGWGAGNKLHQSVIRTCGKYTVRCELEVEVFLFEQLVHECNDLDHELILAQVVSRFENDTVLSPGRCSKRQPQRSKRTLEDVCLFRNNANHLDVWVNGKRQRIKLYELFRFCQNLPQLVHLFLAIDFHCFEILCKVAKAGQKVALARQHGTTSLKRLCLQRLDKVVPNANVFPRNPLLLVLALDPKVPKEKMP